MNDNFWQILIAVFGGSGVWELIKFEVEKHKKKLSDEEKLMLGIAHDRIWSLGSQYLRRKGITKSELDNLERIAVPYLSGGGAGTKYDASHVSKTYARIDGGTSNPGYFTAKQHPQKRGSRGESKIVYSRALHTGGERRYALDKDQTISKQGAIDFLTFFRKFGIINII